MPQIKWKDHNTNQTGSFLGYYDDDWKTLDELEISGPYTEHTFDLSTDFDDGESPYTAFVTLRSSTGSLYQGVKIAPLGEVSLTCTVGATPIEFVAAVLVSDDPKVKITPTQGTANCVMTWTGQTWSFSGDGAPASGCQFEVAATQVTITVNNYQIGTSCAVYCGTDATMTQGEVVAQENGTQLVKTVSVAAGGGDVTYIANVFSKLDTAATLRISL